MSIRTDEEWRKLYKKYQITAKKYMGDDCYSWAVFKRGQPIITGLSRYEVPSCKRNLVERLEQS